MTQHQMEILTQSISKLYLNDAHEYIYFAPFRHMQSIASKYILYYWITITDVSVLEC